MFERICGFVGIAIGHFLTGFFLAAGFVACIAIVGWAGWLS